MLKRETGKAALSLNVIADGKDNSRTLQKCGGKI